MKIAKGRPRSFIITFVRWNKEVRDYLIDLQTNKVFSKLTLSYNFRTKLVLNRRLESELVAESYEF